MSANDRTSSVPAKNINLQSPQETEKINSKGPERSSFNSSGKPDDHSKFSPKIAKTKPEAKT